MSFTENRIIDFGIVNLKEIILFEDIYCLAKFKKDCLIKLPEIKSKDKMVCCAIDIELIKKCTVKFPRVISNRKDEFLNCLVQTHYIDEVKDIGKYKIIYNTYDNGKIWYGHICNVEELR